MASHFVAGLFTVVAYMPITTKLDITLNPLGKSRYDHFILLTKEKPMNLISRLDEEICAEFLGMDVFFGRLMRSAIVYLAVPIVIIEKSAF